MSEKIFTCMQEVPNLHKNYSSGAIIWGSVHPIEEIILLLNNIGMYNYTAVVGNTGNQAKICNQCNLTVRNMNYLFADPGKARGCSTNTSVINSFID